MIPPPESPDSQAALMDEKAKLSMRALIMDWSEHTGMHGMPNITRSQNPMKRSIWILLLLGGMGIMVWQISAIVQKYYSYPINVQRSVEVQMPRNFPAVSVCNKNPARLSKVAASFISGSSSSSTNSTSATGATAATAATAPPTAGPTVAGTASTSTSSATATITTAAATTTTVRATSAPTGPTTPFPGRKKRAAPAAALPAADPPPPSSAKFSWMTSSIYSSNSTRNLSALDSNVIPDSLGITYTFLDYYNSLTATWKTTVGYQIGDFLIECSVGTQYCNQKNFSRFLHPLYGNCYTFNAARTDQSRVTVLQSGPLHGLKLTLYIEQTEYVGPVANSAGVTVVIHEPNKQPFPEDTGISVSPGQETYIGIKESCAKRLATPFPDDCQVNYDAANKASNNMYSVASNYSLPSVNYSQTACLKTCIQRKVEQSCNCSSPNLPISDPTVDPLYNSSYRYCSYGYNSTTGTIGTYAKCMQSAEKDAFAGCRDNCKPDCDEYYYGPSLSHSMWPSDNYENDSQRQIMSYNQMIKNTIDTLPRDDRRSFMSKNFVKIFVYFDDPLVYMIVSTEGYGVFDVFSDMGGQVGLWLGLSVLTVFEILEMFFDMSVLLCKKTRLPARPKDAWKWTAANAMARGGGGGVGMNSSRVDVLSVQMQQIPPPQPALPDVDIVKSRLPPSSPPNWYNPRSV